MLLYFTWCYNSYCFSRFTTWEFPKQVSDLTGGNVKCRNVCFGAVSALIPMDSKVHYINWSSASAFVPRSLTCLGPTSWSIQSKKASHALFYDTAITQWFTIRNSIAPPPRFTQLRKSNKNLDSRSATYIDNVGKTDVSEMPIDVNFENLAAFDGMRFSENPWHHISHVVNIDLLVPSVLQHSHVIAPK